MNLLQIEIPEGPALRGEGVVVPSNKIIVVPIIALEFDGKTGRTFNLDPKSLVYFWEDCYLPSITGWSIRDVGRGEPIMLIIYEASSDTALTFKVRSIHILQEYPEKPVGIKERETEELLEILRIRVPYGGWGVDRRRSEVKGEEDFLLEVIIDWYYSSYHDYENLSSLIRTVRETVSDVFPSSWEVGDTYIDHDSCRAEWKRTHPLLTLSSERRGT